MIGSFGRFLVAAWLLFCVAAAPASAQQEIDNETFNNMVARWNTTLDFPEILISDPEISPENLELLTENVQLVRELAKNASAEAKRALERQQNLLDALGPPPGEGETPEPDDVATNRTLIEDKIAVYNGRIKQSRVVSARAKDILSRISEMELKIIAGLLTKRSPSPLSRKVFTEGIKMIPHQFAKMARLLKEWWSDIRLTGAWIPILMTLLFAVAGLGIMVAVRRWLVVRHGMRPNIDHPSLARRFVAIIVETLARIVFPILMISLVSFVLISGLTTELSTEVEVLFLALTYSLIEFVVITGLARTALTSERPQWRIINFTNEAAASLENSIWIFAVTAVVVNMSVITVNPVLQDFDTLRIIDFEAKTAPLIVMIMIGLVVMSIAALNVLRSKNWRFYEQDEDQEGPVEQPASFKVKLLFGVARVAIVLGVLFYLFGYLNLGLYIGGRTVLTLCVVALAVILHGLVGEGMRQATSSENVVGQWVRSRFNFEDTGADRWNFWIVLLLDVVLVVALFLLLLNIWGIPWDEVKPFFTALMYGTEIGGHTFSLVNIGIAVGAFVLVMIAVKLFQGFLSNRILVQTRLDVGVRDAVTAGVGYVGVVVAALVALSLVGLEFGEIALIFSALSIGIGFGLQHVVNNFISGLVLLVQRPIKAGDWIVLGQTQGYVKRIQVISTEITTFDNATVIVPNSQLMTTEVMNWTHRGRLGRVVIAVGVSYGADPEQVRDILLKCAKQHSAVLSRPPATVVFKNFGESSLDFELRVFIREIDYTIVVASELRFAIKKALDEAGIEIPFPQRDVHLKSAQVPIEEPPT